MGDFCYTQNVEYHMSNKADIISYGIRGDEQIFDGAYRKEILLDNNLLGLPNNNEESRIKREQSSNINYVPFVEIQIPHSELNSNNNFSNNLNYHQPQPQHQQQHGNHINIDAQVQFPSNRNLILNQNQNPPVLNNHLSYQNPMGLSNMNVKNSAVNRIEDRGILVNSYNLAQQCANQNNKGLLIQNSTHNRIGYSGLSGNSNLNIQHSVNTTAHNMNTGLNRIPGKDHPVFNNKKPKGFSQLDDTNNGKKGKKSEVSLRKNKGSLETLSNRHRQVSLNKNINEDEICFISSQESQSQNLINSHNMVTTSQNIYAPIKKDLIYSLYDQMHRVISTSQDISKKNKEYLIKIKGAHIPDESKKCGTFYLIEIDNKPGDHIMFMCSDNQDFPFQIRSDCCYHVHLIDYSECNYSSRYHCVVYLCTMVEEWHIDQRR